MECTKCGKKTEKGTTIKYYWTPVLKRYRAGNQIASEYNKANFDMTDMDWVIAIIFVDAIAGGMALMETIFALRCKNSKNVNQGLARMAYNEAYRKIYIPNGGKQGVCMWRN